MPDSISRRTALAALSGSALALGAASAAAVDYGQLTSDYRLKGNIHHSVCRWCYHKISLDDLCQAAKRIGMQSVELLTPDDFPTVQKHGLICAMVSGCPGGIPKGLNRIENHDAIVEYFERAAPIVARAGFPNIICFSGNRRGMDDEQGMENCVIGLKRIAPIVEKRGVTACMELLNSKIDHHDYMCDHSAWGIETVKRVGSDRVKLLFDIYHMQIMEGDIIRSIRDHHQYFGHFHTGGIPDRHEIDQTQELYYPAVMRAIVASGFQGFVAQEFVPKGPDPLASLKRCVEICDV